MGTSSAALPTGADPVVADSPGDDLWTSDTDRGVSASEPVPGDGAPVGEPGASPASSAPAADASAPGEASPDRNEAGQFTKRGKARDNPYARMTRATQAEAAAKEEARQAREEAQKAKDDAARWQRELDAARRPQPSAPPPRPQPQQAPRPTWSQFESQIGGQYDSWGAAQDAYQDARDAWKDAQIAQARAVDAHQGRVQRYQASLAEAAKKYPNAEEVFSRDHGFRAPPALTDAVLDAENPGEVAYYLGTHPEEYRQLAQETWNTPASAAVWVRRHLLAQLSAGAVVAPGSASPAVRPSSAKPPISRVGGTVQATPAEPDDLEFGPDFMRIENERERARKKAGRW